MSKLIHRRVAGAKVETTYKTDAVPTGSANAVLIEELGWSLAGLRMDDRPAIRPSLGKLQQLYGGALLDVNFKAEVKGSGTAGTAPEIGPLFLGCGMAETIVASTSVTYAPASTGHKSDSIYIWEDGTLIKLTGSRGELGIVAEVGSRMMASFNFQGHFAGPTDVALVTPTYDSTVPKIMIGGNFSIGGYGAIIQALNINLGNVIQTPPDFNSANGYGEVQITGRDVNGSFNPEQTLVATKDFMAALKAGTLEALDTGVLGSVAGNRVQIQMPKVYYRDISPGERDGVQIYDLPFGAAENATDDEISIVFT